MYQNVLMVALSGSFPCLPLWTVAGPVQPTEMVSCPSPRRRHPGRWADALVLKMLTRALSSTVNAFPHSCRCRRSEPVLIELGPFFDNRNSSADTERYLGNLGAWAGLPAFKFHSADQTDNALKLRWCGGGVEPATQ